MWVRSEYAGELAVLSAWLCALLPWGVTYARLEEIGSLYRIHFLFGFFQFVPGTDLGELETPYLWVADAPDYPVSDAIALSYRLWLLAAAVFAVALALSVAYYALDERLEATSPVDPVRAMGALLVATAAVLTAALWHMWGNLFGYTVPVGVLFMYLLGGLLLVVQRADVEPTEATPTPADGSDDRSDRA